MNSLDWCDCVYNQTSSKSPAFMRNFGASSYDARCRSWFMKSNIQKEKVLFFPPYLSDFGEIVYITMSKYITVGPDQREAVVSVDISPTWEIYKVITNMGLPFLDHVFMVDLNENLVFHSRLNQKFTKEV